MRAQRDPRQTWVWDLRQTWWFSALGKLVLNKQTDTQTLWLLELLTEPIMTKTWWCFVIHLVENIVDSPEVGSPVRVAETSLERKQPRDHIWEIIWNRKSHQVKFLVIDGDLSLWRGPVPRWHWPGQRGRAEWGESRRRRTRPPVLRLVTRKK